MDFSTQILVGENVWAESGIIPTPVFSYSPEIGLGHEDSYQELPLNQEVP